MFFPLAPPEINDLPEEFVVIQGEEYTIKCGATGSEPLTYTWYDHVCMIPTYFQSFFIIM